MVWHDVVWYGIVRHVLRHVINTGGGEQHRVRGGSGLRPGAADVQQHRRLRSGGVEAHRLGRCRLHAGEEDAAVPQGVSPRWPKSFYPWRGTDAT